MDWTTYVVLAIGLFCGYMAGRASQKRKQLREARVWELLVDAARRNKPLTAMELCTQSELGVGSLYPLLSQLEKQRKIVRTRETTDDGELRGYFYVANVNPQK